ncbi:putative RNA-directed DNA polymerase from transposon BS [Trichonephila clavipes]|nr:putative RNA-directed DNA polymerase from transposon BS [Trichonephila clavipes]
MTKSFLLAKTFLDSPLTVSPHSSLNTSCGVISEPNLLTTPEAEILDGFSDQGVIQCQRFGHSQVACHEQLTCSRCASVGHASSDCSLDQKCVNCSQPHSSVSKLCPKWKLGKEIQSIKTNKNITYVEARKLIAAQPSQTYAQAAKSLTVSNSTQTDKNITKIVCPPLKLLQPASSLLRQIVSISIPTVSTSSASTQAHLLLSASTISESQLFIPTFNIYDPLYLADQAIVKKSRKRLLPKYNETGTSFLQISKSNIPTKFAAIAVKKFTAQKLPLIPRREKRPLKTICNDIKIKRTPK